MLTFHCDSCDVFWAPYMAARDGCPECGAGVTRSTERMTAGAIERYRDIVLERRARELSARRHSEFEDYYARRQEGRAA